MNFFRKNGGGEDGGNAASAFRNKDGRSFLFDRVAGLRMHLSAKNK